MKNNLRNLAYETLKKKITTLEYKPGDRLFDSTIAEDMGISRTPVREALLALERDGLVDCNGNNGYIVHRLTLKEADDHFAMRELLEAYSVKLIMDNITEDFLEGLRAKIDEAEECVRNNDIANVIRCNSEIHRILYNATGSQVFVRVISLVAEKLRWITAISLSASNSFEEALRDHKDMLAAIEARNAEALDKAIRVHLGHAKEKYLSVRNVFF
ncbi:MAG: GntR family transcriptional regulator [Deltaproteobacteria bacterium]|nr:GntR family transcriptional regulator [Deltaproteobacteria bacterium]